MAKAKLTTRAISSTTVTSDNLAKGSQLTHNQLDSNFLNLRDQTFGIAADDSATIQVGAGDTIYIQGGTNITTSTDSAGVVTINGAGDATSLTTDGLVINQNDITGSRSNEDIKITPNGTGSVDISKLKTSGAVDLAGATTVNESSGSFFTNTIKNVGNNPIRIETTATAGNNGVTIRTDNGPLSLGESGDTYSITSHVNHNFNETVAIGISGGGRVQIKDNTITSLDSNADLEISASGTGTIILENLNIAGDGATVTGIKDEDTMSSNSAVKLATQQSIKAYVDAETANVASDTMTLTNKTFDAEGTGNSLSNVDVANLKSGVLDTDISSVSGSDDTLASAKAIKTYVDSQVSGASGSGIKVIGDDSAGVDIAGGGTLYIQGGTNVTTATDSAGVVTINAADNSLSLIDEDGFGTNSATRPPSQQSVKAYVDAQDANIASDTLTLTNKTFDAEGTGNSLSNVDVANLKSGVLDTDISSVSGSDDTLASAKAIKTYVDSQVSGVATGQGFKVIGDDSAGVDIPEAGTLYIQGGTNVTTATDSAGVVTINATAGGSGDIEGVTAGNGLTGGGTTGTVTLNVGAGTGIDVASDAISVDVSDFLTNGSDNRIVTATGADAMNGEANLTFDGSTLAVTGAATVSTTLGVTGASTLDGVTITDNHISSNRSNDSLHIEANGTGQVELGVPFDNIRSNSRYNYGVNKAYVNGSYNGATRIIANNEGIKATATQTTSSTNFQLNAENRTELEMAGFSFTSANEGRGLRAKQYNCVVGNANSSTASTIGVVNPVASNTTLSTSNGNITATNVKNYKATLEGEPGSGKTATFTTGYNFHGKGPVDLGEGGTTAGTNYYGLYIDTGSVATNNYGVWINDDSYTNKLGGVTLQNGDVTTSGVIIHDNSIKTANSNANLEIGTNGTGVIELGTDDSSIFESTKYTDFFGSTDNIRGVVISTNQEVNANTTSRNYQNVINQDTKLITASSSSNSNFRQRTMLVTNTTDMNGFSYTRSGFSRGPIALTFGCTAMNSGGSASTLANLRGVDVEAGIYVSTTSNLASDITITDVYGTNSTIYCADDTGENSSGSATITDAYNYRASYYKTSGDTITDIYAFYNEGAEDSAATNRYAFYSLDAAASSRMGAIRLDNQSGDPTHGANFSWIYAKDDSSSSEVHVKDEAGNVTKISPHNKAGEWEYYSKNTRTGKTVRVNMERMIRKLEEVTGETFIETV